MTFLSHSLPWLSLSRLFEYRAAKSGPGPQEPDLRGREGPAHRKQLEHFAKQFQDVVREHALIERGKYSTARAYHQRATSWTVSSLKELPELVHDARSSNVEPERRDGNSPMGSSTSAWTTVPSTEERRVYPAYFSDTYMSLVSPTSGGPWGRLGLLASLADISTWIDHCAQDWVSSDEESRNQVWLDNKSCSDVLRLLVIDAATTSDESRRTKNLSTLLLITNHPGVGLSDFLGGGMSCCNLSTGLAALVDKTVMVFIYLNLLLALADDDVDGKLLSLCDSLEQFKLIRGLGTLVRLLPRPAYMNTKSFALLIDEVLYEHGHAVEHILFNPLFAPRPSGCRSKWLRSDGDPDPGYGQDWEERFERDVMTDRQSLGEALKSMWRVLIFCDMLFREAKEPINWEYVSLEAIAELFRGSVHKLVGQAWDCYEADRKEQGDFAFYASTNKI